ncbi:hypothetical protein LGH83_11790 [Lichenihabitans sp. PAMC28606]|uniref:hypothetical protein n=1 Tax=Lichenihabitans TaxID=2723776 RepID=UPI0010384F42|nr:MULTISPECIES: hypothetical protein [Lichenihabitans]UDL93279.1 hypothetical protein LGH83_11790 [Lichenihabitans sp. PAMC28606]
MRRIVPLLVVASGLALSGCQSDKNNPFYDPGKPIDKMTSEELCSYYKVYLSNPDLTPELRKIGVAKQRQKGCSPA